MNTDMEIFINQLVQGIHSIEKGVEWFSTYSQNEQLSMLRMCYLFIIESGALPQDVPDAIQTAKLRASFTPCALLSKGTLKEQIAKVLNLPSTEYIKSFRLLIALLSISDSRRRLRCAGKCHHWWHRDLSNPDVIREIKSGSQSPK